MVREQCQLLVDVVSLQDQDQITASIPAHVQSYVINAIPTQLAGQEVNVTLEANDNGQCISTICQYTFQTMTEMTGLYYSFYISAKNILFDGYSTRRICNNMPICKMIIFLIQHTYNLSGIFILCSSRH